MYIPISIYYNDDDYNDDNDVNDCGILLQHASSNAVNAVFSLSFFFGC